MGSAAGDVPNAVTFRSRKEPMRHLWYFIAGLAVTLGVTIGYFTLSPRETLGQRLRRECVTVVTEYNVALHGGEYQIGWHLTPEFEQHVVKCIMERVKVVP